MQKGRRRYQSPNLSGCLPKRIPWVSVHPKHLQHLLAPLRLKNLCLLLRCLLLRLQHKNRHPPGFELASLDDVHVDVLSDDVEQVTSELREELEIPRIQNAHVTHSSLDALVF